MVKEKKIDNSLFSRFIYWDKFDFILGAVLSTIFLSSLYAFIGGAKFRDISKIVAPVMPYIILIIIVYFCVDKAMALMRERKTPLLSPERCKDLTVRQMLVIGFFGYSGSLSLLTIAIIITTLTMVTMNPEAFSAIMEAISK